MPFRPYVLTRRNYFGSRNGARVVVHRVLSQESMSQHRHEFTEIAVVLSGTGIHVTGEFRHEIGAGDILVLDSRRSHGYEQTRNLNLANILIREDTFSHIRSELDDRPGFHSLFRIEPLSWRRSPYSKHLRLSPSELEQVADWIIHLEEEARPGSHGGRLLQEAYLTLILDILSRKYERTTPSENGKIHRSRIDARLGQLLAAIEKNLEKPFSISDMARQVKMSERTFHRIFLRALNLTPKAYVIEARIARATARLSQMEPGESITTLAESCGFEDSNYFSRCFRQHTGLSPREYQRRVRR